MSTKRTVYKAKHADIGKTFTRSHENRPTDVSRRKTLAASLQKYGFLVSYPISCVATGGKLVVKDGQHRLALCMELGLDVYYVIEGVDYDIAEVNSAVEKWRPDDYAGKHAASGNHEYAEGLSFARSHGLPIRTAFAMLSGTMTFQNVRDEFRNGSFEVRDRDYANAVAGLYSGLVSINAKAKKDVLLKACMMVARVDGFCSKRMLQKAKRRPEMIQPYSTTDACLTMLEEIYNSHAKTGLVGLKAAAYSAMRARNAKYKHCKPANQ